MNEEIEIYLNWKGTYAPRAKESYEIWLRKFNNFVHKEIKNVEIFDLVSFKNHLEKLNYRPKSVQYAFSVLHNFFKFWSKKRNLIIQWEEIKIPKAQSTPHQAITIEEFNKMIASVSIKNFWDLQSKLILYLLYDTGMRVAELCDLNVGDIEQGSAVVKSRKVNLRRRVFWSEDTQGILDIFLEKRLQINSSQSLLIGRFLDGTPSKRLTTRSVQRKIKEIGERAGLKKKITPHSFRHGKAHQILQKKGTVKDVSAILGHQHPMSSFIYLQWSDMELKERAEKFL